MSPSMSLIPERDERAAILFQANKNEKIANSNVAQMRENMFSIGVITDELLAL